MFLKRNIRCVQALHLPCPLLCRKLHYYFSLCDKSKLGCKMICTRCPRKAVCNFCKIYTTGKCFLLVWRDIFLSPLALALSLIQTFNTLLDLHFHNGIQWKEKREIFPSRWRLKSEKRGKEFCSYKISKYYITRIFQVT